MTAIYYSGDIELKNCYAIDKAKFISIGGQLSKHNAYDSFKRMVGHPVSGFDAVLPVTRLVYYKANPSRHVCSARCMNATGHNCECECGGKNHGINH